MRTRIWKQNIKQTNLPQNLSEFASSWIRHLVVVGCGILEHLNLHTKYNALTDKFQAAQPEKTLSEIKSACTTSCRPVVLQSQLQHWIEKRRLWNKHIKHANLKQNLFEITNLQKASFSCWCCIIWHASKTPHARHGPQRKTRSPHSQIRHPQAQNEKLDVKKKHAQHHSKTKIEHSTSASIVDNQKINCSQRRRCHSDPRLSLSMQSGLKSSDSQIRRPHAQSDKAQLVTIEQKKRKLNCSQHRQCH